MNTAYIYKTMIFPDDRPGRMEFQEKTLRNAEKVGG
jgi:hypothetical protein